ncbi:MAG TPA: hypothetical protein EYI72_03150 [Pelagibacteraceae bacterium]|nr:hypothetical protein [Pelagibacteraceae bacterium]
MRGKASQVKSDDDHYGYKPSLITTNKRLNVNNLLRRIKDEEKKSKKLNLLIFSGSISVVLVFFLLLSL